MATNDLSTRVTFRYLDLARKLALAHDATRPAARSVKLSPAVRLVVRCLRISESVLQPSGYATAHDKDWRAVAALLRCATKGSPLGAERISHALAVLHFVERTLGLSNRRYGGRTSSASFVRPRVRSRNCGTYSTPDYIVDGMMRDLFTSLAAERRRSPLTILDMSLEGGHFALGSRQHAPRDRVVHFHGIDADPEAVELATRILGFATREDETAHFSFRFVRQESLIAALPREWPSQYDAIVGNPPWGARKSWVPEALRHQFEPLLRGHYDVYLAFILRAHALLKPGGYLSYVIPSGFLFNCTAAPIRTLLLENYDILALTTYSQRSFVEIPCIIPISFLVRKKDKASKRIVFTNITNADTGLGGPMRKLGSARVRVAHIWKKLPDCGMNPSVRNETAFLAKDLPGVPLVEYGRVSSGARFGKANRVGPTASFRAIRACDMRPYHACSRASRIFRKTDSVFDRAPDETAIGIQKVVFQELRYMTHGQRLVAAVAGPGSLPVSTAGLFVPDDQEDSLFFAALLNSAIANAWYKFRDVNRAVKISYLRRLPVPKDMTVWRVISSLARSCMDVRMFIHKHSDLCTVRNETNWLPKRFPEEWARLVRHQRAIDTKLFDLYNVPAESRSAVLRLGTSRCF